MIYSQKKIIHLTLKFFIPIFLVLFHFGAYAQYSEKGKASYYAQKFNGRKTASGEIYRSNLLTAAHKFLPFGTIVKVFNPKNGKSVTVKINDRGPFAKGRIIDLSRAAAEKIGLLTAGVATVEITSSEVSSDELVAKETNASNSDAPNEEKEQTDNRVVFNGEINEAGKTYGQDGSAVSLSGYGIQLGAFKSLDYAMDLAESLHYEEPHEIFIRVEEQEAGRFYKVVVGQCIEKEEAKLLLSTLERRGLAGMVVKHL